jgi:hypothetical protein
METVKARIKRLWDMFKLTLEKWEILQRFQNDVCWICGDAPTGRRLATDHDWVTGEVRGLLCHRCNTILGKIEKPGRSGQPWTIEELDRAVEYKKNPPARAAWGEPHFGWPGSVTTKKHRKMLKRLAKIQGTPR